MTKSLFARFKGWRWWHGWRGWLVFVVVTAIVSTFSGIWLANTFSPPSEPWSKFPGVPQFSTDQILKNETIEQLEPRVDEAMAEIRAEITAEFGFEWVLVSKSTKTRESNRYHGQSLLYEWMSDDWQTIGTLRDPADKQKAVAIAKKVMKKYGFTDPDLQNFEGRFAVYQFGGFTLNDQGLWSLAGKPAEVSRGDLYFQILDLNHDHTKDLTKQSQANVQNLGWQPEYLSVFYSGDFMLSEVDKAEFEKRAEPYRGKVAPPPGSNKD